MAEIIAPQKAGRRKLQAPRIDLTPMVDLGFLLITFFMFTTTLANHKVMQINMPSNEPTNDVVAFAEEATTTLIATKNHQIAYYNGVLAGKEQLHRCSVAELRNILLKRQAEVAALPAKYSANAHKLHVLIKPNSDCTYADVVNLLDEMNILQVPFYCLVDITTDEVNYLKE